MKNPNYLRRLGDFGRSCLASHQEVGYASIGNRRRKSGSQNLMTFKNFTFERTNPLVRKPYTEIWFCETEAARVAQMGKSTKFPALAQVKFYSILLVIAHQDKAMFVKIVTAKVSNTANNGFSTAR